MRRPDPRRFPSRIHPESTPFHIGTLHRCDVCKRWQAWGIHDGKRLCRPCLKALGGADTAKPKPRKKPGDTP